MKRGCCKSTYTGIAKRIYNDLPVCHKCRSSFYRFVQAFYKGSYPNTTPNGELPLVTYKKNLPIQKLTKNNLVIVTLS